MRPNHHTLDRDQLHRLAAQHLRAHLQFKDYKRKVTANTLWALLLAAARITSLSDACQRLLDGPPTRPLARLCWPPSPTTPRRSDSSTPPWPATSPRRSAGADSGWP